MPNAAVNKEVQATLNLHNADFQECFPGSGIETEAPSLVGGGLLYRGASLAEVRHHREE